MGFKSVGLRLPEEMLHELKQVEDEESLDRSTVARQMLLRGLRDYRREKAVKEYSAHRVSISEAAEMADLTVWEFEELLVKNEVKSQYSVDDLQNELKTLSKA